MKTWLKEFWWWLTDERFSILLCAIFYGLMLLFTRFMVYITDWTADKEVDFWRSLVLVEEPEICALCEDGIWMNYRGPCMVSFSSGEIRELNVYRIQAEETTEESNGGYVHFFNFDGAWSSGNMPTHTCEVTLPEEIKQLNGMHFCRDCRAKLAEIATEGYILADLYDADNFALFPVTAGEEYVIREYTVTVTADEKSERLTVHVTGNR